MEWFTKLPVVLQALLATLFTYGVTALGAATVFFFKDINRKVLDGMLGFAAGVMIAASFFSLLAPAIEMADAAHARGSGLPSWAAAAIGFLLGGIFLRLTDVLLPHLHQGAGNPEGIKTNWGRSILLVLAITLHNIPEGLAVGVGFGAASIVPGASLAGALSLALGIGLQNFPEGAAVSIPLRRDGMSRSRSFFIGQASGIVEPIAAVVGSALVLSMQAILPYALSFAAGAMIFVVAEELIPEAYSEGNEHIATAGLMFGFALMMMMDVGLG
ncbi:ZIP family metal transporter [Leadbettera azotonutricia]|uniref:Zinc transporter, ZIP family n=1 Tax=Leadbettera azotonutricia (strain ATCC BAA-888 / DSM 13862 / ZAS-9) TaxID=545695 RepID=F5YFD8_LEAAZ|nr:ZIP family metal transporter [Leadbettera azotonutricia]AEF80369.1 zinc transporter, ZIP family [Leadbettera azotonutricia ZAS-9]